MLQQLFDSIRAGAAPTPTAPTAAAVEPPEPESAKPAERTANEIRQELEECEFQELIASRHRAIQMIEDDSGRREAILRRAPALRQRAKDAMQEFLAGKLSEAELKDAQAAAANADGIGIDASEQSEVATIDARRGLLEDAEKELTGKINSILSQRQKIERLHLWYEVKAVRKEAAEALTEVARVMVKLGRLEDRYGEAGGTNAPAAMRNLTFAGGDGGIQVDTDLSRWMAARREEGIDVPHPTWNALHLGPTAVEYNRNLYRNMADQAALTQMAANGRAVGMAEGVGHGIAIARFHDYIATNPKPHVDTRNRR